MEVEINKYGKKWDIIEDLKRCLNIYYVFKFINENQGCTVREINNETGINKNTIYKYIEKGVETGLINKDFNGNGFKKNGAHFIIIVKPKIKDFLIEFKRIIFNFCKNMSEYNDIF